MAEDRVKDRPDGTCGGYGSFGAYQRSVVAAYKPHEVIALFDLAEKLAEKLRDVSEQLPSNEGMREIFDLLDQSEEAGLIAGRD